MIETDGGKRTAGSSTWEHVVSWVVNQRSIHQYSAIRQKSTIVVSSIDDDGSI